jgi:hypothetical protein
MMMMMMWLRDEPGALGMTLSRKELITIKKNPAPVPHCSLSISHGLP